MFQRASGPITLPVTFNFIEQIHNNLSLKGPSVRRMEETEVVFHIIETDLLLLRSENKAAYGQVPRLCVKGRQVWRRGDHQGCRDQPDRRCEQELPFLGDSPMSRSVVSTCMSPQLPQKQGEVGRIMAPKDAHLLIPGTCKYTT